MRAHLSGAQLQALRSFDSTQLNGLQGMSEAQAGNWLAAWRDTRDPRNICVPVIVATLVCKNLRYIAREVFGEDLDRGSGRVGLGY